MIYQVLAALAVLAIACPPLWLAPIGALLDWRDRRREPARLAAYWRRARVVARAIRNR